MAPDCVGERIEGCRSCRTATHTAATCPLGGVAPSQLLPAPSPPRASAPAVVTASASSSLMAPVSTVAPPRALAQSVEIVGAAAAVTPPHPRSDFPVDLATEPYSSNTSLSLNFSPSTISLTEPTVLLSRPSLIFFRTPRRALTPRGYGRRRTVMLPPTRARAPLERAPPLRTPDGLRRSGKCHFPTNYACRRVTSRAPMWPISSRVRVRTPPRGKPIRMPRRTSSLRSKRPKKFMRPRNLFWLLIAVTLHSCRYLTAG
jgi:hypothetical protein